MLCFILCIFIKFTVVIRLELKQKEEVSVPRALPFPKLDNTKVARFVPSTGISAIVPMIKNSR